MVKEFGEKVEGVDYQLRNGVYAIVTENDLLALVQTPNHDFYLPGGEIEAGENEEEALKRELIEELGYTINIGAFLGRADEYFYSSFRDKYFHNPGFFYASKDAVKVAEPLEDQNVIHWVTAAEAKEKLKRESHIYAVEQWEATL
ncbi:MAG: NUDIX domain-containing protein [Lactobacillales bacterium]|jgi:8-oxo-dGTP diphosphatase|nr:NUDIX domain-containing protein [Lactobacillales bacterium]